MTVGTTVGGLKRNCPCDLSVLMMPENTSIKNSAVRRNDQRDGSTVLIDLSRLQTARIKLDRLIFQIFRLHSQPRSIMLSL